MAKIEQKEKKNSDKSKIQPAPKIKRMRKGVPRVSPPQRSSIYRGVTRHRWTGRYEAHLWDKNCWNETQSKKGRQVYLGAYDEEEAAAHAYDLAALRYWGHETTLNFPVSTYEKDLKEMEGQSKEEYIGYLRRKSSGFSRGVSKYRGVARHHHNGRWEARIGRVLGNKYLYLGTFATQEEAAIAYDKAAIHHRGQNAVTNFEISRYANLLKPDENTSDEAISPVTSLSDEAISPVTSLSDETISPVSSISDEMINPIIGLSDEAEVMSFIVNQYQSFSSTFETQENLPDSPSDFISSPTSELIPSPKNGEISEKNPMYECLPMNTSESRSRGSIFPEEIQTYFDWHDTNSYVKGDDDIFGELNLFVSSMFEFEL